MSGVGLGGSGLLGAEGVGGTFLRGAGGSVVGSFFRGAGSVGRSSGMS